MTRSPTTTEPVAPTLPSRLRMVVTRLARRLRQQTGATASPTQLAALATIERVRPPTITAAVGRLEEQRLVHRRTDVRDRRVAHVEITSQGRRLLAQSRSRKTAYLERQLAALTADERDTLERAAAILERVLEKEPT